MPNDDSRQSSSYAIELLSGTRGTRVSCIGHILDGQDLIPWYYDAAGMFCAAEPISMISDFATFAAYIIALAFLTPQQLGVHRSTKIQWPQDTSRLAMPVSLKGCSVDMFRTSDGSCTTPVRVTLGDHVLSQHSLVGRRTLIYRADIAGAVGREDRVIIKFSYQPVLRTPEQVLLAKTKGHNIGHLPELFMASDLFEMKDGVREILFGEDSAEQRIEGNRIFRAIVYRCYESFKELVPKKPLLMAVMVDQIIDCECSLRFD